MASPTAPSGEPIQPQLCVDARAVAHPPTVTIACDEKSGYHGRLWSWMSGRHDVPPAAAGGRSLPSSKGTNSSGRMSLRWFNSSTRCSLAPYSGARDGRIGVRELTGVVGDMVQAKVEARVWLYMLCVLAAVAVVLLGCSFGLTWAVVQAHKDTQVKRGTWVARGTDEPIMVGSVSYTVNRSNGALSARGSGAALATGELLLRRPLHSGMGLGQLQGLTRVLLRSSRGAQVALRVTGVTLVPLEPGGTAGGAGTSPSPSAPPATSLHISTPGGVLQVVGGELRAGGVAAGMAGEGDTWTGPVIGIFSTDAPT